MLIHAVFQKSGGQIWRKRIIIAFDQSIMHKGYRDARKEMQNYTIAQKNISILLGEESVSEQNAQPSRDA